VVRIRCIGLPQFGQAGRCLIRSPTGSPKGRICSLANMLFNLIRILFLNGRAKFKQAFETVAGRK